eukprot:gene34184-41381_t
MEENFEQRYAEEEHVDAMAQGTSVASQSSLAGGNAFSYHKPIVQNKSPPGRGGASVVYADGKLIAFGGHFFQGDDKFTYLNETWVLDTSKHLWHKVNCT